VPQDLVSVPEVAQILGVSRQRVHQLLRVHADFPEPEAVLAVGRIWKRVDIVAWAKSHPRKPGRPARD
jgi:predicted DNA-binding transcriptional regulator AlpA